MHTGRFEVEDLAGGQPIADSNFNSQSKNVETNWLYFFFSALDSLLHLSFGPEKLRNEILNSLISLTLLLKPAKENSMYCAKENSMYCKSRSLGTGAMLILALSLLLPASLLARNDKVPADQAEAGKWIADATRKLYNIDKLDGQYLLCSSSDGVHYGIALARITSIRVAASEQNQGAFVSWQDYTREQPEAIKFYGSVKKAESFAAGLTYLATAAREQAQVQREASVQQFLSQARAWREASPKPQMPEAAREHQVLAEYAFKQRETDKAIREYQSALDVFPTWPEGQFNLATLAGEQKGYGYAILHMKEYLELVPDSPDTQAAKDSIIIWKDKLNSFFGAADNASAWAGESEKQKKKALSRRSLKAMIQK